MTKSNSKHLRISVVVATYNRGPALGALLEDLAAQSVATESFEVIVVDDGSGDPALPHIEALGALPYALTHQRQENQGPAAARDNGIAVAAGELVVVVDDDMRIESTFLQEHLHAHESGCDVVLGYIASPDDVDALPIFERFHAEQLERFAAGARDGEIIVRGVHLCTGNVSFKREAYLAVGGFDRSLGHSEDRELGIRLEKAGYRFGFRHGAKSSHESDRASLQGWYERSRLYGVYDSRISRRHPELEMADPWRFLFRINMVTRPFALSVITCPWLGAPLASASMTAAQLFDRVGVRRPAEVATTFSYGMQYFAGVREEAGSLRASAKGLLKYIRKRRSKGAASG